MPNQQSRKNIPYYSATRPKTPHSNLCPLKNFITTSNEQCQMQFDSANLRGCMSPGKWLMWQTAGCFSVLLWRKNISEWFFVRAHSLTYIAIKNQQSWFFFPPRFGFLGYLLIQTLPMDANGSSELEFDPHKIHWSNRPVDNLDKPSFPTSLTAGRWHLQRCHLEVDVLAIEQIWRWTTKQQKQDLVW